MVYDVVFIAGYYRLRKDRKVVASFNLNKQALKAKAVCEANDAKNQGALA